MLPTLNRIKGIHPGLILKRELNDRGMKASELAQILGEHKQTISAILNTRRDINPKLSIKLAEQFDVDQDYFMLVQASYDVKQAADLIPKQTPDLSKFRKVLFWDTTLDKIDWQKNRHAIIQRVLERGNSMEINEIISYYGKQTVSIEIQSMSKSRISSFQENLNLYNLV